MLIYLFAAALLIAILLRQKISAQLTRKLWLGIMLGLVISISGFLLFTLEIIPQYMLYGSFLGGAFMYLMVLSILAVPFAAAGTVHNRLAAKQTGTK